ncbi:restriction endonuclease subunit S [Leptolyngbya sp. PCC 6406]|uniref:restriction endonuclease subunit S n=1 Tax=Leptolyngbya sp. PCC 6406 TaxID=1173264 RepID=UPI0002ABE1A5|nr:restriction endonuclease subunit S [Leptolyngbya sp. PCC 6406]
MRIDTPFECVSLKDVVYLQEGPGLRNWQYGNSGIPFLNIRTLTDEGIINKQLCQFVKEEEFHNKYEHFLLDAGDYVVSSSGTLGKLAEVRPQDLPVMLNTSVIRFRPLDYEILDRVFLKWFIKSPLYIRQIEHASTGTAIKNYGPSHLKKMIIPLPPIAEQRRIAAILDKADAIRRKRKQAIQYTEELLRAAFLDMFGDPVTNPKRWEIWSMKDVIKNISTGWSAGGEEEPLKEDEWGVLKISSVTTGEFIPTEFKNVGKPPFKKPTIVPKKGDLLFTRANTRELVAATCLVEEDCKNIFLPDKIWSIKRVSEK